MTCEVKKILHFTAVFYEHSAAKITKELIILQLGNCGFGIYLDFFQYSSVTIPLGNVAINVRVSLRMEYK